VPKELKIATVYLNPDTGEARVESSGVASKLNLEELQSITHHLQSWIFDIAEIISRSRGLVLSLDKEERNNGHKGKV
jgi:hypothetical protein